ncbi:MAG: hypothetical protein AB7S38_36355 [Vulcanimicrobiota bacterium]
MRKLVELLAVLLVVAVVVSSGRPEREEEYVIHSTPSVKVIEFLSATYPEVHFARHPSRRGLVAVGSREEIARVRSTLHQLEVPEPPPPPAREFLRVKPGELETTRERLQAAVPTLKVRVEPRLNCLLLEGEPADVRRARELVDLSGRPVEPSRSSAAD